MLERKEEDLLKHEEIVKEALTKAVQTSFKDHKIPHYIHFQIRVYNLDDAVGDRGEEYLNLFKVEFGGVDESGCEEYGEDVWLEWVYNQQDGQLDEVFIEAVDHGLLESDSAPFKHIKPTIQISKKHITDAAIVWLVGITCY